MLLLYDRTNLTQLNILTCDLNYVIITSKTPLLNIPGSPLFIFEINMNINLNIISLNIKGHRINLLRASDDGKIDM